MAASRAERLFGLLNDEILALPKAPTPEPTPIVPRAEEDGASRVNTTEAWAGSPKPAADFGQHLSDAVGALALDDRAASPSPSPSESSHEPDENPREDRPAVDLLRGDLAPWGEAYVSVQVASRFPYKFLSRAYTDQVAKKFFDRNQFWKRDWDLYYIWPPADIASKPLILITASDFQLLLDDINTYKRHIDFCLTDYHRDCGLIIDIPHPALTPRYLGLSSSREEFNDMERRVPSATYRAPGEPVRPSADKPTLEAFKARIEEAMLLNKAKNKAAKAKRKEQRINMQQNWGRMLKRTQRYLGLRPDKADNYNPLTDPTLNWAELQAAQAASKLPALDPGSAVPFPFDKHVVFISVDIEAFELDNNKITEIGVATLDVLDIMNIPPGKDGKNWFDKIRARHFRIDEYAHLENYRHVSGCAGGFEFGKSEFARLADAPSVVASCFKPPFSAQLTPAEAERLWSANGSPHLQGDPAIVNADGKRNIIFVGHDPNQDIKFLQKLGYNPLNLSNLIEVLDTKLLHQHWKRDTQGTSLGKILADLDIIGWKLHNGGNDAVYTMQALVSLSVREASRRGSQELEELRKQEHQKRLSDAIAETVAKVSEEAEGWSSVEEGDDGGVPVMARNAVRLTADENNSYIPPPGHDNPVASDCLFVGNIPYRAAPDDVVAFFAKYGTIVDVHLPISQSTARSKGVAYVSFSTAEEAKFALEKCKGIQFWGRPIRVDLADPREKKGGRGGRGTPSQSQRPSRSGTPVSFGNNSSTRNGYSNTQTANYQAKAASALPLRTRPTTETRRTNSGQTSGSNSDTGGANYMDSPSKFTQQQLPDDWW